jgi:hypothetical protein
LVLFLSCPLLAQEKTYDQIFDDAVFMHPGFDLGQIASGSMNYQRYGPEGYGSEAEGHGLAISLNYQRYGANDCGSEAEGYWQADQRSIIRKVGTIGYGTASDGD